jgi:predicted nucleotidyltransferase
MEKLHWNTVSKGLKELLKSSMAEPLFSPFRLVGGTALSLYLGHRISVDIDLFTDAPYDSIDFDAIKTYLENRYPYVSEIGKGPVGMGKSYLVGPGGEDAVKVDLYYNDDFIRPYKTIDGIRLADMDDIAAMKIHVVQGIGRMKDFWDIHELLDHYTVARMIELHKEKYPYHHDPETIVINLTDFHKADTDFKPECLRGKHWELIRLDIAEAVETFKKSL